MGKKEKGESEGGNWEMEVNDLGVTNNEIVSDKFLVVFQGQQIRRTLYNDEWWFVIVDVVKVLTGSANPRQYIKNMRNRDEELSKGWVQIEHLLSIGTAGGKQKISCANTEGMFRIIQSISSKKAEPFKRWLAKVGYERVQEIENPELAQERMKMLYEEKGYPKSWIDKRLRGIAIRQDLTDEWEDRGIRENKDFAILTNEIAKATFEVSIEEHKKIKGMNLKFENQNLRDHIGRSADPKLRSSGATDLELIFSMLGEKLTTETTRKRNAGNFVESKGAAIEGGQVAGRARKDAEKSLEIEVVSKENYLDIQKKNKKLEKKKKLIEVKK